MDQILIIYFNLLSLPNWKEIGTNSIVPYLRQHFIFTHSDILEAESPIDLEGSLQFCITGSSFPSIATFAWWVILTFKLMLRSLGCIGQRKFVRWGFNSKSGCYCPFYINNFFKRVFFWFIWIIFCHLFSKPILALFDQVFPPCQ